MPVDSTGRDRLPIPGHLAGGVGIDQVAVAGLDPLIAEDLHDIAQNKGIAVAVIGVQDAKDLAAGPGDALVHAVENAGVPLADQHGDLVLVALQHLQGAVGGAPVYHEQFNLVVVLLGDDGIQRQVHSRFVQHRSND